jgi:hypothetical protein
MRPALLVVLLASGAISGCARETAQEKAPSELVGVIVEVEEDAGNVTAFTLEVDGDRYTIFVAEEVEYGFDLRHLHEHRSTGEPVRCTLEERGDRLYALQILDA